MRERRSGTGLHKIPEIAICAPPVETFDSGDKIIYSYTATGTLKDGKLVSGIRKFTAIGGTGKMKGIKASGTCKTMGNDAGGLDHSCTGDYTMGAAPAAKK